MAKDVILPADGDEEVLVALNDACASSLARVSGNSPDPGEARTSGCLKKRLPHPQQASEDVKIGMG